MKFSKNAKRHTDEKVVESTFCAIVSLNLKTYVLKSFAYFLNHELELILRDSVRLQVSHKNRTDLTE